MEIEFKMKKTKKPKKSQPNVAEYIEHGRALVEIHNATTRRLEQMMDELHQRNPQMMHYWSHEVGIDVEDNGDGYAWGMDHKRVTIH